MMSPAAAILLLQPKRIRRFEVHGSQLNDDQVGGGRQA
jgi:hypothetical protein